MKTFLIIGLGAFGGSVARTLHGLGHHVVGLDMDRQVVEHSREILSEALELDTTDRDVIDQLVDGIGAENIEAAVVGVGRKLDASILACLYLKEKGIKQIVAKVLTHDHARIVKSLGVDQAIFPESESGIRLAHHLARPNLVDLLPLGNGVGVFEVPAPKEFVGSTLGELNVRSRYNLMVVAIRRGPNEEVNMTPGAETLIQERDILVVLGKQEALNRLPS